MDEKGTKDDILILNNALIFNTELGGESAKEIEADVLLLTNAVMQEPVVKKIDVGPRISGPELLEARAARDQTLVSWKPPGWNIIQPPKQGRGLVLEQPSTPILSPMPSEKMPESEQFGRSCATYIWRCPTDGPCAVTSRGPGIGQRLWCDEPAHPQRTLCCFRSDLRHQLPCR